MFDADNDQGAGRVGRRGPDPRWGSPRRGGRSPRRGARARGDDWTEFGAFRRHGGHGSGGFGRPGSRRGRKAGRGDVRAAILALLAEAPMHGYQIMSEIAERSGGAWRPSPGSVYPTLQALEDERLVTGATVEGRRVFELTPDGRKAADALGEGPAPWDEAARHWDPSLRELGRLVAEVAQAMAQVARTGTPSQVEAVRDILADTRRRIYLVLADGPSEGSRTGSGPGPGDDTAPTSVSDEATSR